MKKKHRNIVGICPHCGNIFYAEKWVICPLCKSDDITVIDVDKKEKEKQKMNKNEALENIKETLYKVWEKKLEDTPNRICCVCGHPLDSHRDEGEYWRCHHLDASGYQCECRLIKKTSSGQGKTAFVL